LTKCTNAHLDVLYNAEESLLQSIILNLNHWRILVKNIGWEKPKILGDKVVKSDKCMGVSQLLGARARAAPQSLRLWPQPCLWRPDASDHHPKLQS